MNRSNHARVSSPSSPAGGIFDGEGLPRPVRRAHFLIPRQRQWHDARENNKRANGGRGSARVLRTRLTKSIVYKTPESKVTTPLPLLSPDPPCSSSSSSPPPLSLSLSFSLSLSRSPCRARAALVEPRLQASASARAGTTKGTNEGLRRGREGRDEVVLDRSHRVTSGL